MQRPTILITTGDPEGIGPEITEKALRDTEIKSLASFKIIGSRDNTGFDAIKEAVEQLKRGSAHGLVTGPVSKTRINKAGICFEGHTEYLAKMTNTKKVAMMFYSRLLKVTVVTRHIPLKKVAEVLTKELVEDAIVLTHSALEKYFGIKEPRIGVSGLNPHCGEKGLIGDEEERIIIPTIKSLKLKIKGIIGPISSDVIFYLGYNKRLDAIVCMYHDQGLGAFKMVSFNSGVNVTLGLPFIRTSPDHGPAYDIAQKGIADAGSMKEAIKLACAMYANK